ncbi:MAG: ABC transporter ATP-binding protein, partial [Bacteroidota bacterium]
IKVFEVDRYWKNPVGTYSSGMLKKIALTMAFCGNPRLILLDEPFTTIDAKSLTLLCDLIKDFYSKGCSFIISAHQLKASIPLTFDATLFIEEKTLKIS